MSHIAFISVVWMNLFDLMINILVMATFASVEELDCYRKCRLVRIWIFSFLKNQKIQDRDMIQNIKSAGRSTTRNIAEGFGRYHHKENRQYCLICLGSLHEILDDLNIMEDEQFCCENDLQVGRILIFCALKSTQGYIDYLGRNLPASSK